jgi:hypothetical protein
MKTSRSLLYGTGRTLLRVGLGFYFARIERFHPENVPASGPVLFTLIVHLPHLERARIVEAVKRLYLDQLWVGNTVIREPVTPQAGELLLTQAIAQAVDLAFAEKPQRASEFTHKLDRYERALKRLHLSDEVLSHFPERKWMVRQSLTWAAVAVLGAPIALYGWLHRLVPYGLVQWIVKGVRQTPGGKTGISTATIISGLVVFTAFYALCIFVFHYCFNWRVTVWYALSLPVASLAAHYYVRELRRFAASLRAVAVLVRAPSAAQRLLAARAELIALIEAVRQDMALARVGGKGEMSR